MPLVHHDFDYWDGVTGQTIKVNLYDAAHTLASPSPITLTEIGSTGRYIGAATGLAAGVYRVEYLLGTVVLGRGVFRWDGTQERSVEAGAVWDEATSDHATTGSTGEALTSASATAPTAGAIADAVWQETFADHNTVTGSVAQALLILQALAKKNYRVVSFTYTGPRVTAATVGLYANKADMDGDSNRLATLTMTAAYDAGGKLTVWKQGDST